MLPRARRAEHGHGGHLAAVAGEGNRRGVPRVLGDGEASLLGGGRGRLRRTPRRRGHRRSRARQPRQREPGEHQPRSAPSRRAARVVECLGHSRAQCRRDVPGGLSRSRGCERVPLAHVRARPSPPPRRRAHLRESRSRLGRADTPDRNQRQRPARADAWLTRWHALPRRAALGRARGGRAGRGARCGPRVRPCLRRGCRRCVPGRRAGRCPPRRELAERSRGRGHDARRRLCPNGRCGVRNRARLVAGRP